jgi:hypothetical protein
MLPTIKGQGFQANYTRSINTTTMYEDEHYLEEF